MLAVVAPPVSRPVKVALVRISSLFRMKSSAFSVSSLPAELGCDRPAIFPSGFPVEKKNGAADDGDKHQAAAKNVAANVAMERKAGRRLMASLLRLECH